MGAGVGRLEARKDLRADRAGAAVGRTANDSEAAVDIGVGLARRDSVFLRAELRAGRELQRRGHPGVEGVGQVQVGRPLVELQAAVVEGLRAGVAEGDVLRVRGAVIEPVRAEVGAEVVVPLAGLALDAAAKGVVLHVGIDEGKETVRPDGAHRAVVARTAEEAGAVGVTLAGAAEEVEVHAVGQRIIAVEPEALVLGPRVTETVVDAVDGGLAGVEDAVRGAEAGARAVGAREGDGQAGRGADPEILLARVLLDPAGGAVVAQVEADEQ